MTRARLGAVAAVVLVAAAVLLGWRCRAASSPRARPRTTPPGVPRLDVQRFRDHLARHREGAQALRVRFPRAAGPATAGQPLVRMITEPRCILGPAELCAELSDSVDACADGDARACVAIGQYLEDTPPRPLIGIAYYHQGCKLGDAEACARVKAPAENEVVDCARDLMWCAHQASRERDLVRLDDACDRGVADACAMLIDEYDDEPALVQAYLTKSCQLGNPMACEALGQRLAADCTDDCFAPEPEQALAAKVLACEAGFERACDGLPP